MVPPAVGLASVPDETDGTPDGTYAGSRSLDEASMPETVWYSQFAKRTAHVCGRPRTFALAVAVIAVWIVSGPLFAFSDTWQLVINTGTTIVTFLMVFLIQNTQNRDARVTQLKLDELIRAVGEARTGLVAMEEMTDEELERLEAQFHQLHKRAGAVRRSRAPARDRIEKT